MSFQALPRLFLLTIVYLVSFISVTSQAPTIQLPCSSATPNSTFCMGSLGSNAALTGSGCMADQNCEVVLIGEHFASNNTIEWHLMTSLVPGKHEEIYVQFFALRVPYPKEDPPVLPPEIQNVSFARLECDQTKCLFCSSYFGFDGPAPKCEPTGNEYYGQATGDLDNVEGWKTNPFRSFKFESKTVLEPLPYRVDFVKDTLWPYLDVFIFGGKISEKSAGLLNPVKMFCDGDQCPSASTTTSSTTAPIVTSTGVTITHPNPPGRPDPPNQPNPQPTAGSSANNKNVGIIIGSVIGGIVALVVIVGLIWFVAKKKSSPKKKKKKPDLELNNQNTNIQTVGSVVPVVQVAGTPAPDIPPPDVVIDPAQGIPDPPPDVVIDPAQDIRNPPPSENQTNQPPPPAEQTNVAEKDTSQLPL